MVARGGVVVDISSVHGDRPMPGDAPYRLSEGGLRMLTRTAAVEPAPHGVRVVGLGPDAVYMTGTTVFADAAIMMQSPGPR